MSAPLHRQYCRTKMFDLYKMKIIRDIDTKRMILEAAESVFLEKGYGNAKMLAIAKKANVSHSMLHYYFSSKENLFQTIFMEKIHKVSISFETIFDKHAPFFETVRLIVETQFDFVAKNPKLPHFLLNEILSNKENRALLFEALSPKAKDISMYLETMLSEEIKKGTIRPISMAEFLMNMVSINLSAFILLPVIEDLSAAKDKSFIEKMLSERRESNVQFILNALRP